MGRTMTLLLTALVAIVLGLLGTVAVATLAVKSSADAAKMANEKDLGVPEGYGAR